MTLELKPEEAQRLEDHLQKANARGKRIQKSIHVGYRIPRFKCHECGETHRSGWKRTTADDKEYCVRCYKNLFEGIPDTKVSYFVDGDDVILAYKTSRFSWNLDTLKKIVKLPVHKQDIEFNNLLNGRRNGIMRKTMLRQFVFAVEDGRVLL